MTFPTEETWLELFVSRYRSPVQEGGGEGGGLLRRDVGVSFRPKVEPELPLGASKRKFEVSTVELPCHLPGGLCFAPFRTSASFLAAVGLCLHLSERGGLTGSQILPSQPQ